MANIKEIEGIGPAFAQKLKQAGVSTTNGLLEKGASPGSRRDLAQATGLSDVLILKWVNHADLFRIKGVGSEYAELLEAAGVDSIPELAQRVPLHLYEKMLATNREKKLVRRPPSRSQVESWVIQAKGLPRIVHY